MSKLLTQEELEKINQYIFESDYENEISQKLFDHIDALTEQRDDDVKHLMAIFQECKRRAEKAEAELKRRDALAGEAINDLYNNTPRFNPNARDAGEMIQHIQGKYILIDDAANLYAAPKSIAVNPASVAEPTREMIYAGKLAFEGSKNYSTIARVDLIYKTMVRKLIAPPAPAVNRCQYCTDNDMPKCVHGSKWGKEAPAVPDDEMVLAFHKATNDGDINQADFEAIKVGLQAAFANACLPVSATPVTVIDANHSDPDLSPGEYSVNISTKGGAAIINGAPPAPTAESPTKGMNLGARIAHVGGRNNAQGYIEFASPMAIDALIQGVLRDMATSGQDGAFQARYRLPPDGVWSSWGAVTSGVKGHEQELRFIHSSKPAPAVPDRLLLNNMAYIAAYSIQEMDHWKRDRLLSWADAIIERAKRTCNTATPPAASRVPDRADSVIRSVGLESLEKYASGWFKLEHIATADVQTMAEYFVKLHRAAMLAKQPVSAAIRDVIAERQRQIGAEGWTPEHDDQYKRGELELAAACYAAHGYDGFSEDGYEPDLWPWASEWWKPTTPRRDKIKSAALLIAAIERLDRANGAKGE